MPETVSVGATYRCDCVGETPRKSVTSTQRFRESLLVWQRGTKITCLFSAEQIKSADAVLIALTFWISQNSVFIAYLLSFYSYFMKIILDESPRKKKTADKPSRHDFLTKGHPMEWCKPCVFCQSTTRVSCWVHVPHTVYWFVWSGVYSIVPVESNILKSSIKI